MEDQEGGDFTAFSQDEEPVEEEKEEELTGDVVIEKFYAYQE